MTPRPPLYQPSPLRPGASAVEVEKHEAAMTHYAHMRRDRDRSVVIDMLVFILMLISGAVAFTGAIIFGEHIFLWYAGTLGALLFGGLCWAAALLVKELFDMRGERDR